MRAYMVSCLAAAACGDVQRSEPAFTFALVTDLTGPAAATSPLAAVSRAIEEANEALTAGGYAYRFAVLPADSGSVPTRASAFARELATLEGARGIIVGSQAEAEQLNMSLNYGPDALSLPIVCAACSGSELNNCASVDADPIRQAALRDRSQMLFRTVPTSNVEAELIVERLLMTRGSAGDVNGDGVFKIAMYRPRDSRAGGFARDMEAALAAIADPVWGEDRVLEVIPFDDKANPATYNCDPVMEELLDAQNSDPYTPRPNDRSLPDAILGDALAAFDACLVGAYRLRNSAVHYVQRSSFRHPSVIELLALEADGLTGISPQLAAASRSGEHFAAALRKDTGLGLNLLDANYFDAAIALVLGTVAAAEDTRVAPENLSGQHLAIGLTRINDARGTAVYAGELDVAFRLLAAGSAINYEGASGPVDFTPPVRINPTLCDAQNPDSGGNVTAPFVTFRATGGTVVETAVLDCVAAPDCPAR